MPEALPIPGPLGLGDLLDRAFRLYRARFWRLALITALFYAPFAIAMQVLRAQFFAPFDTSGIFGGPGMFGGIGVLIGEVLNIPAFLVLGLVVLILAHQCIGLLHGEKPAVRTSVRAGLRRYPAFLVVALVKWPLQIGRTITGTWAPVAAAFGLFSGQPIELLLSMAIALLIWLLSHYLSARWLVTMPGLVAEGWGPITALRGSWRLTRGHVRRSFGYLILLILLEAVLIDLPMTMFQFFVGTLLLPVSFELYYLVPSALGLALSALWYPLYTAAIVMLYYDLRVRKEAYDLSLRVEQLEALVGTGPAQTVDLGTLS
jgi:hypothetical protein